jgi:hypothetical protein
MRVHRLGCELFCKFVLISAASIAICGQVARADGPIGVVVQTTDASPITINASDSHMLDLTSNILNNRGPFAALAGRPFTAVIHVGGVRDLLQLTSDAAGTGISVRDPHTGQVKTFLANTKAGAQAQIHSFLQTNLNKAFVGYQRTLNGDSGIGVTDGNPLAATSFLGTDAFNRFGIDPAVPVAPAGQLGRFAVGVDASGGEFRTNSLDGNYAQVDINLGVRFSQLVGLVLSVPIEYRSIQGTNSYTGGVNLGLPFTIFAHPMNENGFNWQVTPWAMAGGAIDEPLLSGGGIAGGGLTSSLGYQLGDFTFTMANQAGYDTGFDFPYDDYSFNTPVDQWIFKNGLYATYTMSNGLFVDGGASYTNLLHDAGVSAYVSPRMGAGYRWGKGGAYEVRLSYIGDFGKDFSANGVQAQFHFSF